MKKRKYKNSGYSGGGASVSKPSLKTWFPQHYSAKSDVEENLKLLRERAYDLATNSAIGAAIINCMTSGVIGSQLKLYPTPQFDALNLTAEQARNWSRRVQLLFNQWADSLDSDFYRRNNFYEMARIAFQSSITDGDIFCLFRRRLSGNSTLALQLVESQRISNPLNNGLINNAEMLLPNGHRVINGVEVDKWGRLLAIHVSNKIWNDPSNTQPELKWQRVKIFGENGYRNVLHICYDTRPEMFRGAPLLSAVVESLKQVARFTDAELSAAIIKSFFSLFFIQQQTTLNLNSIVPQEEIDVREYRLGSGTISALPRGVDVKSVESAQNQKTFAEFTSFFIKTISAAVGLPVEVVLKSYNASYSASRASILQAEQTFRERRQAFINDFLQPVYETFLAEMVASGQIAAPKFFEDAAIRYSYSRADWRREVMGSIDENKSATAAAKRIETGISSRRLEATRLGNDYDLVADDLAQEGKNENV